VRAWAAILAAGLLAAGLPLACVSPPPAPKVSAQAQPSASSHVQVQVTLLGQLPNGGVFLPALDPPGRQLAYLEYRGDQAPSLEAVLAGELPQGLSLHVRPVDADTSRMVAPQRAGWPVWSRDGATLYYVSSDQAGRGSLCLYDLAAGQTARRITPAAKAVLMPAVSPDGRKVAFISPAAGQVDWRLHVLVLETGEMTTVPDSPPDVRQAWPGWTGDGRLVYLEASGQGAWVCQWAVGQSPPQRVAPVGVPDTPMGLFQACAGVARPISPDGRWFACYDASLDAVVLADLGGDGRGLTLREGTHGGCWLGPGQFVASAASELILFPTHGPSSRLLRGAWVAIGAPQPVDALQPRGAGQPDSVQEPPTVLLCGPGPHAWAFNLVRLSVGPVADGVGLTTAPPPAP
jgi:hypothetical protein